MKISKRIIAGLAAALAVTGGLAAPEGAQSVLPLPQITRAYAAGNGTGITTTTGGTASNNMVNESDSLSSYSGSIVRSVLAENGDGTLVRVEYTGSTVIAERYPLGGSYPLDRVTIRPELSVFGGAFCGKQYNFLVFAQANPKESDTVEVMRVVKYSKNWQRLGSVSYKGINAQTMFSAGSLRMAEDGGYLYIHTCRKMYADGAGVNHQANISFRINENNMTDDADFRTRAESTGYSSHSFDQYIKAEGGTVYRADLGDAYPRRGLLVSRLGGDPKATYIMQFGGSVGNNYTGCRLGGMELGSESLLVAGLTVDQSRWNGNSNSDTQMNVFVSVTDKYGFSSVKNVMLTGYPASSDRAGRVDISVPKLVKAGSDRFVVMWTERFSDGRVITKMAPINGSGGLTGDITVSEGRALSQCQPIICSDGLIRWYAADGSSPVFYAVDPSSPEITKPDIADAKITVGDAEYNFGEGAVPSVTVSYDGRTLTEGVDYTLSFADNTELGDEAVVTLTGAGDFDGEVTKTFTVVPRDISGLAMSFDGDGFTYSGSAFEPKVIVSAGKNIALREGRDFVVSYADNTDAGSAVVTAEGKGNFTGELVGNFTIKSKDIGEAVLEIAHGNFVSDGTEKKPQVTVTDGGKALEEGKDFEVAYENNIEAGEAKAVVSGKGNYGGTLTGSFTIAEGEKTLIAAGDISLDDTELVYDGTAKKPAVTVKHGGKTLVKGTDYTVTYSDNISAGKGKLNVTGIGGYKGSEELDFTIKPKDIADEDVEFSPGEKGTVFSFGDKTLKKDTDYTISTKEKNIVACGIGNFTGEVVIGFIPDLVDTDGSIEITEDCITISDEVFVFDGTEKKPSVTVEVDGKTLTEGKDYAVQYENNVLAGTACVSVAGMGDYTGASLFYYEIKPFDLSQFMLIVAAEDIVYDGTPQTPLAAVFVSEDIIIMPGDDLALSYTDNIAAGEATVIAEGKGNFSGRLSANFIIAPKDIADTDLALSQSSYAYDGTPKTPAVAVRDGGKLLIAGVDYTLEYSGNVEMGTGIVTVRGIGNYGGMTALTFTIGAANALGNSGSSNVPDPISGGAVTYSRARYDFKPSDRPTISEATIPEIKSYTYATSPGNTAIAKNQSTTTAAVSTTTASGSGTAKNGNPDTGEESGRLGFIGLTALTAAATIVVKRRTKNKE